MQRIPTMRATAVLFFKLALRIAARAFKNVCVFLEQQQLNDQIMKMATDVNHIALFELVKSTIVVRRLWPKGFTLALGFGRRVALDLIGGWLARIAPETEKARTKCKKYVFRNTRYHVRGAAFSIAAACNCRHPLPNASTHFIIRRRHQPPSTSPVTPPV